MNASHDPANQRTSLRIPASSNVWLQCHRPAPAHGPDLANGLLDLSAGGVQWLCKEPLAEGALIDVQLGSAGLAVLVRRTGEVRWVVTLGGGACCVGLRFREPLTDE